MTDVHVIGAGIHPFGRHPEKTGLDQGVFAVREALADAGVVWEDIQFAFGGSSAAGAATFRGSSAAGLALAMATAKNKTASSTFMAM